MKKIIVCLLAVCGLLAVAALASGGGSDDPLVSLSYLEGAFWERVEEEADEALDASDQELLEAADEGSLAVETVLNWTETRLKQGDALLGSTGTNVLVLAGGAKVTYSSGAVVDVTTGSVVPSGSALSADHRYMVAEDTSARFEVTSRTAVVDYLGSYDFAYSDAVDYNTMAAALKSLNLFKGSFTGYGQGYDLELVPTRLQALIMFIRVLGEEEEALAWTGTTPFTDISKGSDAEKYVGYAYEKGYTNGYTTTQFKPGYSVSANQYTEFVLRAMGYSSSANTDLSDTMERARDAGLLTYGETELLQTEKFLRADLVYISYYALDSELPGGGDTLADLLIEKGVFTRSQWRTGAKMVDSDRL